MSQGNDEEEKSGEDLTVTIAGTGVNISLPAPMTKLPVLLSVLTGAAPIPSVAAGPVYSEAETKKADEIDPRMSLREFLNEANPSTNSEMIVATAYFLWKSKGLEKFASDDIRKGFKEARENLPSNLSRDIGTAVSSGWIANGDHSREYFVTNTGEKAVLSKFGD